MIVDKDAFYGRTIVYDGVEEADRIAEEQGGTAKHAKMKGNPFFDTFSVVVTPSDRDHLKGER